MSFTDIVFLIFIVVVIIVALMFSAYAFSIIYPPIGVLIPANQSTVIYNSVTSVYTFYDATIPALFIIMGTLSAILTVLLRGHPVILAVWLVISVMALVVYDVGLDIINAFAATEANTHIMDTSIEFYRSGIPKFIPVANLLIALVMLGKRVFT